MGLRARLQQKYLELIDGKDARYACWGASVREIPWDAKQAELLGGSYHLGQHMCPAMPLEAERVLIESFWVQIQVVIASPMDYSIE